MAMAATSLLLPRVVAVGLLLLSVSTCRCAPTTAAAVADDDGDEYVPARVVCTDDDRGACASYVLLASSSSPLLRSSGVPLAICAGGRWNTESNGGLVLLRTAPADDGCTGTHHDHRHSALGPASRNVAPISVTYNVTATGQRAVLTVASHAAPAAAASSPAPSLPTTVASSSVVFTAAFPDGLHNTSACSSPTTAGAAADPSGEDLGTVLSGWPAFRIPGRTYYSPLKRTLSWEGSFLSPTPGRLSTGPRGGPAVFFGRDHVVVGSHLLVGNSSWSAGSGSSYDGSIGDVWVPGLPGTVREVPPGFRSSTLLHVTSRRVGVAVAGAAAATTPMSEMSPSPDGGGDDGGGDDGDGGAGGGILSSSRRERPELRRRRQQQLRQQRQRAPAPTPISVTGAIHSWGSLLRSLHSSAPAHEMSDVTLTKVGYQTDNGSFYCFCRRNCSTAILDKVAELRDSGVEVGYVSFQGAGASLGRGKGAPWCVSKWGPDGGLGPNYEMSVGELHDGLGGLPLQLYAPYFCAENDYFTGANGNATTSSLSLEEEENEEDEDEKEKEKGRKNAPRQTWEGVRSDPTLPSCQSYDFWDATPSNSLQFYDWFFAKGTAVGMQSFEPDFMNQNRNCIPEFIESVDGASRWQQGMADAASGAGVTVQWCYATPADVMASLTMDAVTNFRVSTDYCYGKSWDVGLSSLLPSALGKAPSKDTLWTTTNNRTEIPGCKWTPDHEARGAALHVTLALFTTGPVGLSDGLGYTDAELVSRAISKDGTLLQPSRPATMVDSLLRARCAAASASSSTSSSSSSLTSSSLLSGEGITTVRHAPPTPPPLSRSLRRSDLTTAEVYVTHSSGSPDALLSPMPPDGMRAWYVVSFRVPRTFILPRSDLYPPPLPPVGTAHGGGGNRLAWRRFDGGAGCVDGTDAVGSGCLSADGAYVIIPASDFTDKAHGSDFGHVVTTIYPPPCPGQSKPGWRLLGELTKLVPLSTARFPHIGCIAGHNGGVEFELVGASGESVKVTAVDPDGIIRVYDIRSSSHGKADSFALSDATLGLQTIARNS